MAILTTIAARDEADGDELRAIEWEGGPDGSGHVVYFECDGKPYLTLAELFEFAEQLRDLANKIERRSRPIPPGAIR